MQETPTTVHDRELRDRLSRQLRADLPATRPAEIDAERDISDNLGQELREIVQHPLRSLVPVWSWKSASISALLRACTFFATNLRAGRFDAIRAGLVEACFAIFAAGLMGAVSQRLRLARPAWATAVVVWLAMPFVMLLAQFGVHHLAGTPHLGTGLVASFCFAAVASSFSWYAMRHGVLLGGDAETSLAHDIRHMPKIVLGYILMVPRAIFHRRDGSGFRTPPAR